MGTLPVDSVYAGLSGSMAHMTPWRNDRNLEQIVIRRRGTGSSSDGDTAGIFELPAVLKIFWTRPNKLWIIFWASANLDSKSFLAAR
jgi:hypothetical protein